jgi:hypothetical protein
MPRGDEENFRLINSFNDIFVAIGIVIMLVAAGAIGSAIAGAIAPEMSWSEFYNSIAGDRPTDAENAAFEAVRELNSAWIFLAGGALIAAICWPLAEFFTRKRRMALPSIILLLAFIGGVFSAVMGLGMVLGFDGDNEAIAGFLVAFAGLFAAGAAYLHYRRFMVPITVAAGAGAVALTVISLIAAGLNAVAGINMETALLVLVFLSGLAIFALAMRWDMTDPERTTRRSDIAFWLHLLAAPMIAHPIFVSTGVMDGGNNVGVGSAVFVLAIYVLFGLIALAIDRRAMLVSALAYVLAALAFLFDKFGAVELGFALTALVIGSALLSLSAFWTPIRSAIVGKLPADMQSVLPATQASTQATAQVSA